jgi:hypothetical protein
LGGLTLLLVVAATALIGVSSASAATVLCSRNEAPTCATANILPSGTYVKGEMTPGQGSFVMDTSIFDITCAYALLGAQTDAEKGSPLPAHGEAAGPYQCSIVGAPEDTCSSSSASSPSATITPTTVGRGTLTLGVSGLAQTYTFTCKFPLWGTTEHTCVFGSEAVKYGIDGLSGNLYSEETPLVLLSGGGGCGSSAKVKMQLPLQPVVFVSKC